jgi:hypothetical protein
VPTAPPAPGTPVLGDGSHQVGEVIRAAPAATGSELLAVVDHATAGARLTCGGAALAERPLPFETPRD